MNAATSVTIGQCAGWLHHADGDRGVVMCASFGYEALCAHQSWRVLADRLAAAGLPTLRFDYPGEGDSLGALDDPELVARWTESIRDAVAWMRETIGVREVALVGLRLGASLAATVGGVDHLVQIAPVVKGSAYLRELKIMARMLAASGATPGAAAPADNAIELEGFSILPDLAGAIERIDLASLAASPAPRILLMQDPAARPAPAYAQRLEGLGARVATHVMADYRALAPAPAPPAPPLADFDALVAFLREGARTGEGAGRARVALSPGVLTTASFVERRVRFGANEALAGVLCVPRGSPKATVVLLNTGANHHIGCGRSSVAMARAMARRGVASLRMDCLGIGDSAIVEGGPRAAVYRQERGADVSAALDFLETRGLGGAALFGVCSGATLALYAALSDPRIEGLLLANMQVFGRIEGAERERALDTGFAATATYVAKAMSAKAWARVATGEVSPRKLLAIGLQLLRRKTAALGRSAAALIGAEEAGAAKAREARDNFAMLARRGARVLIVHGDRDVGREEMEACFGADAKRLRRLENVSIEVIDGADHALASQSSREAILDRMLLLLHGMERSRRGRSKSLLGALTVAALGAFTLTVNLE